jgi:hypothetical protein
MTITVEHPKTAKHVEVWLDQTSEPLKFEAISTYQKGSFYCVSTLNALVHRFPIDHIFRVVEDYGTHGGGTL